MNRLLVPPYRPLPFAHQLRLVNANRHITITSATSCTADYSSAGETEHEHPPTSICPGTDPAAASSNTAEYSYGIPILTWSRQSPGAVRHGAQRQSSLVLRVIHPTLVVNVGCRPRGCITHVTCPPLG